MVTKVLFPLAALALGIFIIAFIINEGKKECVSRGGHYKMIWTLQGQAGGVCLDKEGRLM